MAVALLVVVMVAAVAFLLLAFVMAVAFLMVMVMAAMAFFMVVVAVPAMVVMLFLAGVGGVRGLGLVDQLGDEIPLAVHDRDNLLAVEGSPIGRDDCGRRVFLLQQIHRRIDLGLARVAGAAEDQAGSMADLVIIKLTEILHIEFDLVHITDRDKAVEGDRQHFGHALHRAGHVRQFANAGRLDQDTVGVVGIHNLLERFAEIADKAAADTAGVEFVDLDAGLPHEAAVDADFTELIFDQHELFTAEGFLNQLFDEGCLARAKEAGKNINFGLVLCHDTAPFYLIHSTNICSYEHVFSSWLF